MDDVDAFTMICAIVMLILSIGVITHAFVLACEIYGWVADKAMRYRYGRR